MTESPLPILEVKYITFSSDRYQELVKYKPDPRMVGYIRELKIHVDATTAVSNCQIKININGADKVKNEPLVVASTVFTFGGSLVFHGKIDEGIKVYVKSDGTDVLKVLGTITGIEVMVSK